MMSSGNLSDLPLASFNELPIQGGPEAPQSLEHSSGAGNIQAEVFAVGPHVAGGAVQVPADFGHVGGCDDAACPP